MNGNPPCCIQLQQGGILLFRKYEVCLNSQIVGSADVEKRGLYYHIICKCNLPNSGVYRVSVQSETMETDLGICVPMGNFFGLETNVPVKKMGEGKLVFQIASQRQDTAEPMIPIDPQKPFIHIDKLQKARLIQRDGTLGIIFTE